jgi:hypothetical protein
MRFAPMFAVALVATPAGALTVLPDCTLHEESIDDSYRQFDGYANEVVMAWGTLRADELMSEERSGADGEVVRRRFHGSFRGKSATLDGFAQPYSVPVLIDQRCKNDDCFPRFDGTDYLVFLQKTDDGYWFEISDFHCAPAGFASPGAAGLAKAIACLKGECP